MILTSFFKKLFGYKFNFEVRQKNPTIMHQSFIKVSKILQLINNLFYILVEFINMTY